MPSLFQSVSSFFTSQRGDSSHLRRDQAMVSVDDAFSVPPDAEYVSSPNTFSYPPTAQGGSYDTVPQSFGSYDLRPPLSAGPSSTSRSRPTPLLPLHHTSLSPLPNYPPLQQTWNRLRAWLDDQYPELADTLNWGIQPPDLAHLELQLGFALPPAVRESYLIVDGQEAESSAGCSEGLFFGLTLLPFEDVVEEWRFWREVDEDPATGASTELQEDMQSIPPSWIRREYSQRGWLPLVADKAGNYIGVDMNPDVRGSMGQVIIFGRDFDTKVVMWRGEGEGGWARWLASFVEELESGEGFEIGAMETSEGSDDGVGYESYFFDGSTAKSQGGDGGGGGLRLTGEYRGWTVLEAFADRSMRRWIEAGVMPQPIPLDETSPSPKAGHLAPPHTDTGPSSPVARSSEWRSAAHINGDSSSSHTHTPKLSITKLPAPMPVQLPTEHDLLPSPTYSSPTESSPVYDIVDEESRMRELDRRTPVQDNYPPSVKEGMLLPLPPSKIVSSAKRLPPIPTIHTQSEPYQDTDNFESLTLFSATTPVNPSPLSAAPKVTSVPDALLSLAVFTPIPADPSESQAAKEEPQPSVRLVGGGGDDTVGNVLLVDGVTDTPDASGLNKKNSLDMSGSSGKRKTEVV